MELSFESLTSGLQVDHADLEFTLSNMTPADRRYVILFTPRSGSSWLTAVIEATELLGRPEEYLAPEFVREVAKSINCSDRASFLPALFRKCKTSNGVFGIEVLSIHLRIFGEQDFFDGFGADTPYYYLWRDNIVAQGVSLYRAVTTGKFHSTDGQRELAPPVYDPAGIQSWTEHILHIENDNLDLVCRRRLPCQFIRYEDIVRDETATLKAFSYPLLGRPLLASEVPTDAARPRRIADEWSRRAEDQFRRDMPGFVEGLLVRRKIISTPQPRIQNSLDVTGAT
jgi:LPS sulfotransferase NodH